MKHTLLALPKPDQKWMNEFKRKNPWNRNGISNYKPILHINQNDNNKPDTKKGIQYQLTNTIYWWSNENWKFCTRMWCLNKHQQHNIRHQRGKDSLCAIIYYSRRSSKMERAIYTLNHKQQQDDFPNIWDFYDETTRCLQGSEPHWLGHAKAGLITTRKQTGGRNDHWL